VGEVPERNEKPKKKGRTAKGGRVLNRVPGSLGRTMQIRQFDINAFKPDYTLVFYGRRRSGKSFLMRHLL